MLIKNGYSPSVIQSILHVSYETVRTYTNQFVIKSETFQKIIERFIKKEKAKEFWKKIDKILKPLDLVLSAKSNMKARAKLASGDLS